MTAVVARGASYSSSLGLPEELVGYRNVPAKESHSVVVNDTSLAKELKFDLTAERVDARRGVVTVDNKAYHY